uniref:Biotin biosynthesis protein BioC n=1 Tax=Paulinella chromatophora TaxID=39717 RepID=B1X3W8_PAUCH|nr:biotin biosynthesis protein BioC [Paulinella chromatophora]ACB42637.1 biotin biosynthesis protein BioC [Paulinella chromatophora]
MVAYNFDTAHLLYEHAARLQKGVAWRLAHQLKRHYIPKGLRLDIGAGTGLLARAIEANLPGDEVIRIDRSISLLSQDKTSSSIIWNLNDGPLPINFQISLIASSFAAQWLVNPTRHIEQWCQKLCIGGWFALALPTSNSFPQWHTAATKARVSCTALPLPKSETLIAVCADNLIELQVQQVRFTQRASQALHFLRQIREMGAQTSLQEPLSPGELRKLNRFWNPGLKQAELTWEILILIGQRP